jgi:hypothetical protein
MPCLGGRQGSKAEGWLELSSVGGGTAGCRVDESSPPSYKLGTTGRQQEELKARACSQAARQARQQGAV